LFLITEIGQEEESVTRLSRVGFDNLIGHLDGGFEAWKKAGKEIDTVDRITAEEFAEEVKIEKAKSSTSVKTVNIVQNMLKMPLASLWLV
jgi:3-mercaptopyruvate sulfurtransferase SseA